MPKNQNKLPNQVGGTPAHDLRKGGTVDAPEHNLRREGGSDSKGAEKLASEVHHRPLSGREVRRAEERGDDPAALEDT